MGEIVKNRITFYDFANLLYSGYFIVGFDQDAQATGYNFVVRHTPPDLLRSSAMTGRWRQLLFSICIFKAEVGGEPFFFCIDTRDSAHPSEREGLGFHLPLLERVKLYFKVNYNEGVISSEPALAAYADKIVPVPLFFPARPRAAMLARLFPRLTPAVEASWSAADVLMRLKTLRYLVSARELVRLRTAKKDLDVFFVVNHYGGAAHAASNEFRHELMSELRSRGEIRSITGFASDRWLPDKYVPMRTAVASARTYLTRVARSRVAIYVRGMYQCHSFKLGELLAMGMPMVGQPLRNNAASLYSNSSLEEQLAFEEPREIVRTVLKVLRQPETLERWGRSNARTYDQFLTPSHVVSDIVARLSRADHFT